MMVTVPWISTVFAELYDNETNLAFVMAIQDRYLFYRLVLKTQDRVESLNDKIRFFNMWLGIISIPLSSGFILLLFLSDDQIASQYYWIVEVVIASLWGGILVIVVYLIRFIWFVFQRARTGIKKDKWTNSNPDIRIVSTGNSLTENYGVNLSTVMSIYYLVGGMSGLFGVYILFKYIDALALWIENFTIKKTTISALLDILRPGLGRAVGYGDGDELFFFFLFGMFVLFFSIVVRGFESLSIWTRETSRRSNHKDSESPTVFDEYLGLVFISRDLIASIILGKLRAPVMGLILHISLAIVLSIPPVFFLINLLFT